MTEQLQWFVGNRDPSVEQRVTSGGAPVDLSAAQDVLFLARGVGSTAILTNGTAAVVPGDVDPATGGTFFDVRYDWTQADVDTGLLSAARDALIWWRVIDVDGREQDYNEALVRISEHSPVAGDGALAYLELEALKSSLQLTGTSYAELDMQRALGAASRAIDDVTNRRFYPDPDANQVRYYSPENRCGCLEIDDLVQLTSVRLDLSGGTAFPYLLVENRDFILEPENAKADGRPWEELEHHPNGRYYWPCYPRSVQVTGRFGWDYIPEAVAAATGIIAAALVRRIREAPFGVVTVGLEGEAVRIARSDPHVALLLDPYTREESYVG